MVEEPEHVLRRGPDECEVRPNVCKTQLFARAGFPTCCSVYPAPGYSVFSELVVGFDSVSAELGFKATQTGTASALCSSASSCSHSSQNKQKKPNPPNDLYIAHASENAAAPPTHLAASAALRGAKQTVIDLRRDCLFCLGADDG